MIPWPTIILATAAGALFIAASWAASTIRAYVWRRHRDHR